MPNWLSQFIEPSARSLLKRINALEHSVKDLSDEELASSMGELRLRVENGQTPLSLIPEVFSRVREAGHRTLNMRHFDVQILGGIELARGRIIEMATGEGKTLVATLPACLHALTGQGVHVVTVNDYLAARDSEWMGKLYNFFGFSTGCIQEEMRGNEAEENRLRQEAYGCDITYGTNSELVFDCLRDNLELDLQGRVHRGFHYAIVDEVDLLLIDEAQTPLIISGPGQDEMGLFRRVDRIVRSLQQDRDFKVDRRTRSAALTEDGLTLVEKELDVGALSNPGNLAWMHAVHRSVQAYGIHECDVDYIVEDGSIYIVDEHTGRVSPDKRYSDGLHQALEAKEKLDIRAEDITLAKTSYQHFFRGYKNLCGMTGTAWPEREEFKKIYFRKTVKIPSNRPAVRLDYRSLIYGSMKAKHRAIVEETIRLREAGQPVLVGSVSVRESEEISRLLKSHGVPHEILNAKHHQREAEIICQAGREGAVTISTNMAGRGTDILLGGNAEKLAEQKGEPGNESYTRALTEYRKRCEDERQRVVEAGGLAVIGSGEHESRRIDDQLRGRAGRQGDPGSSRYFLSIKDPVYRTFGDHAALAELKTYLEGLDGQQAEAPIQDSHVERMLAGLRKKVEVENQAIRLDVFKFDTVVHERRENIWSWRLNLIKTTDPQAWREQAHDLIEDLLHRLVAGMDHLLDDKDRPLPESEKYSAAMDRILALAGLERQGDRPSSRAATVDFIQGRYHARFGSDPEIDKALSVWERMTLLRIIDRLWTDCLTDLERVEEGIGLRGYAQLDPFIEYRKEAAILFDRLIFDVQLKAVSNWLAVDPNLAVAEAEDNTVAGATHPLRRKGGRTGPPKRQRAVDRLPKARRGGRRRKKKR